MSLLHVTGKVLLVTFILYTVFNSIFVVQPQLADAAHRRACRARMAAQPTEPSTSPDQFGDCEWDDCADRT